MPARIFTRVFFLNGREVDPDDIDPAKQRLTRAEYHYVDAGPPPVHPRPPDRVA
jgi:hypothetical protein